MTNDQDGEFRLLANQTGRATVPELERLLFKTIPVLDKGFIRVVDYMGDDAAVVQAARVSYGKGTKKVSEDKRLIKYLMRNLHTTPFEMAEIKFHVRLPIFVARQWIRHRTASVNEYSARYSILDNEFYVPEAQHLASQATNNRQGRGRVLTGEEATRVLTILREDAERNYVNYRWMLNDPNDSDHDADRLGLARELARINLTLNVFTQWYWKVDLHNLMHFLQLRTDRHAQYEIRAYALELLNIVRLWVPYTYEAFDEYRMKSRTLSGTEVSAVARILAGESVTSALSGLSARERQELITKFGLEQKN